MSDYLGTYTETLNLSKDSVDDNYDVGRVNDNSDKIAEFAEGVNTQLSDIVQYNLLKLGFSNDGTTDNSAKTLELESYSKLIIPKGTYYFSKSGFALNFSNLTNVIIEGNGSTILVSDEGINFDSCSNVQLKGIKLKRSVQGKWGENKTGLLINNCNNIFIERNEISYFTDNISLTATIATSNIFITANKLFRCSEEPCATRLNCSNIYFTKNQCYEYLGDGFLNKGSQNVHVFKNVFLNPATTSSNFYTDMTSGVTGTPPICGGGITCNSEDGTYQSVDYFIEDNYINGASYGIGILGGKNVKISKNSLLNISDYHAISILGETQYNPNLVGTSNVIIEGNYIKTLTKTSVTLTAIIVKNLGIIVIEDVVIKNNYINPSNSTRGHHGIYAGVGCVLVEGNTIENYDAGISVYNTKVVANTLLAIATSTNMIASIAIAINEDESIVCNNYIYSEGYVRVNASNNIICDNIINYGGTYWGLYFVTGKTGNIANNNLITIVDPATGENLFSGGDSTFQLLNTINNRRKTTSIPTTGTWKVGDFAYNYSPSELGTSGSMYIIYGWVCTSAGSPGSWRSCRFLTGN
jgi:hypothetical protein